MQVTLPEHGLMPVPDAVFCFDIETYFDKEFNLKKMPMAKYIDDPRSDVLTCVGVARAVDKSDMSVSMEPNGFLWSCNRQHKLGSATHITGQAITRTGIANGMHDRPVIWLIGHNLSFDAGIMRYHEFFPHWQVFYVDTLLMAQYLWHEKGCSGKRHGLGLDALGETLFGIGKMEGFELQGGRCPGGVCVLDGDEEYLKQLAAYNVIDTKITWKLFCYLIDRIPPDHMYTIHWAVKQFVEPTLKLNKQGIVAHRTASEEARQELIDKVPGASLSILRSREKCLDLFNSHDIDVPAKMSPTTKKLIPQLAKGDNFIVKYQHEKSLRGDIIRARLAAQSAIEITRANTMLEAATHSDSYRFHIAPSGTFTHRPAGRAGGGGNPLNLQRTSKLRRAIEAPPGKMLLVFDYSKMELMLARWGAVDKPAKHKLSIGEDMYTSFIANVLQIDPADVSEGQRFVGKTCLAENTPVLTDQGYIPIQDVQLHHKLWDGVEWVSHDGLLDQGYRYCMEYDSIVGTHEHRVYCADENHCRLDEAFYGSKTITRSATAEGYPIRTTRSGRRLGTCKRYLESGLSLLTFGRLQSNSKVLQVESDKRQINALQKMCESKAALVASILDKTLRSCAAALSKSQRQGLRKLWRSWDRVPLPVGGGCSVMGTEEFQTGGHAVWRDRPGGQRRSLRSEQHTNSYSHSELKQQTSHDIFQARSSKNTCAIRSACSAIFMAGRPVFTQILRPSVLSGMSHVKRYTGPLPQRVVGQTQRVYDIANSGPRYRFTILAGGEGKLVSNSQLSLQYSVGHETFCKAINASGKYSMAPDEAQKIVNYFRYTAHPRIPEAWNQCGAMLRSKLSDRIAFFRSAEWDLKFPGGPTKSGWQWPGSGRTIRFPEIREVSAPNLRGRETVYNPMHPINPTAARRIYPGAYFQALCQSCANEVIDHCRAGLARLDMQVVSECYDELTLIIDPVDEQDAIAAVKQVATTCHLDWWGADPPPLKIDIGTGENYYDAKP
jgi:hypothetical protein